MIKMRELAEQGGFSNWAHALQAFEALHHDETRILRIWAGASDVAAIDMIRETWRRAQPHRR